MTHSSIVEENQKLLKKELSNLTPASYGMGQLIEQKAMVQDDF